MAKSKAKVSKKGNDEHRKDVLSSEFTDASAPSELLNPNVSPEEQDMEMIPAVVGPPSYASPDPMTNAGRLRPLSDHPLEDTISEDYGADVSDLVRDTQGTDEEEEEGEDDGYEALTVEELQIEAADREIEGRSGMNKAELVAALEASDES